MTNDSQASPTGKDAEHSESVGREFVQNRLDLLDTEPKARRGRLARLLVSATQPWRIRVQGRVENRGSEGPFQATKDC